VIADAQLAATRDAGAQLALMNPGGIRAPLPCPPTAWCATRDLFSVQPFYNNLVTMTLTGAQLLQVLEQQWPASRRRGPRDAGVARLRLHLGRRRPAGQRVVPGSLKLTARPITPETRVRVTVNSFLASGGDNFTVLRQGRDRRTGHDGHRRARGLREGQPGHRAGWTASLDRIARLNWPLALTARRAPRCCRRDHPPQGRDGRRLAGRRDRGLRASSASPTAPYPPDEDRSLGRRARSAAMAMAICCAA
jgi:hypothetical protein